MSEEQEKALYGYCQNCAEPFDRPYTHCPFCNKPNPNLDKQLKLKQQMTDDRLMEQLAKNREWVDANRAQVQAETDARIEENLQDLKQTLRGKGSLSKSSNSAKPVTAAGNASKSVASASGGKSFPYGLLIVIGGVILAVGLYLLLK